MSEQKSGSLTRRLAIATFGDGVIPLSTRCGVAMGCLLFLTYALLSPNPWWMFGKELGDTVQAGVSDKLQHVIAYFSLSLVLMWCAATQPKRFVYLVAGSCVIHAVATEMLQQFFPPRTTDVADVIANLAGVLSGVSLGLLLRGLAVIDQLAQGCPDRVGDAASRKRGSLAMPARDLSVVAASLPKRGKQQRGVGAGMARSELPEGKEPERRAREINFRFLGIASVVGCVLFGSVIGIHGWQVQRNASALLQMGQKARAEGDVTKAESYLARYVGMVPNDPNALADFGQLLDRDDNGFDRTRRVYMIYEDVLRTDPSREDIRRRQIATAISIERFSDALAHIRILRQTYPTDGRLDYEAGRCLEALGDFTAAAEAFTAAIEHAPEIVEPWIRLARLNHDQLSQRERADELVVGLVTRNRENGAAWVARGRFYLETRRLNEAAADLEHALTLTPDDEDVFELAAELGYARAQDAESSGRSRLAERIVADTQLLLKRGIELHPDRFDLKLHRVMLESHFGKPAVALEMLVELTSEKPGDTRTQLLLADLTIERGEFERAREAIEQLPRTPASDAMRTFLQGRISMSEERWTDAVVELLEARRFLVNSPEMLERTDLALAVCHRAMGLLQSEIEDYRELLNYHPGSVPGRLGLASALLRSEQLPEAIAEYRPLSDIPQVRLLLSRLMIVYNLQIPEVARDWREVTGLLEKAVSAGDDPAQVVLLQAELLAAQGKTEEAQSILREARTNQADRLEFLIALARLAEQAGDEKQSTLWMGQALAAIGNPTEAEKQLTQAVELNPSDSAAVQTLIRFYLQQGRREDALALFQQRAAQLERAELARMYELFGDLGRAVQSYQEELEIAPGNVVALSGLSELYLKHGYPERALPLLERLVESPASVGSVGRATARRHLAVVMAERGDHRDQQRAIKLIGQNRTEDGRLAVEDRRALAMVLSVSSQQTDRDQAVTLFEELDDQQQLRAKDRWILGELLRMKGRSDQAARQLELAIEVSDDPLLMIQLAERLIELGDLERASEVFAKLSAAGSGSVGSGSVGSAAESEGVTPVNVGIQRVQALLATKRGQDRAAVELLDVFAMRRGGTSTNRIERLAAAVDVAVVVAELCEAELFHEATGRYLHELVALDPARVDQLVVWLINRGRDVEAFEQFEELWKHLPVEQAAGLSMAMLTSGATAERTHRVQQKVEAALQRAVGNDVLIVILADLLSLQGEYDEALRVYRNVLELDHENVLALNNASWLLAMQKRDLNDAFALVERAVSVAGAMPHLQDTRGCVRLSMGQLRQAIVDLEASVAVSPQPTTLLHLAAALARQGETERAREVLERAKKLGLRGDRVHPLDREMLDDVETLLRRDGGEQPASDV